MNAGIREARFAVKHRNKLYLVCKLAFTVKDTSFYVFPYCANGQYKMGQAAMADGANQTTFDHSELEILHDVPKISMHESGVVHIRTRDKQAGPLYATPFQGLRGQHVLTVNISRIDQLKTAWPSRRLKKCEAEVVVPCRDDIEGGRFVFYANSEGPKFDCACMCHFNLKRGNGKKMYFGVMGFTDEEAEVSPVYPWPVSCITGWRVDITPTVEMPFLYIVAR